MSCQRRISNVYKSAKTLALTNQSKIVLLSDCHRGNGSLADNLSENRNLYHSALMSYYMNGYTYIELGDGDELWENKSMLDIFAAHQDIFSLLARFYNDKRLYLLYGNHDMQKKKYSHEMDSFFDIKNQTNITLFPGIKVHEGIILINSSTGHQLMLIHGHQCDLINDTFWKVGRFLVRYLWTPLELIGFQDPFSASKNSKYRTKTEQQLTAWAKDHQKILIAGHTHREVFAYPGEVPYFNDGCCVRPGFITAIEIENLQISLVKWQYMTKLNGLVYVGKVIEHGPVPIEKYYG
jgi:predicted phosphodiesterase